MNKNVGELLKELREKKKLSQNQLAAKVHISRSVIAKYETGEREPSFNNLIILSKFFKIPITDLIPIYEKSIESNNTRDILNYLLKKTKSFKFIIITLILILLMILTTAIIYINVINYVSTKVYKISTENNSLLIQEGLLVKTKDKIYLTLINSLDSEKIQKLKLYYMKDKEKIYIMETSNINSVRFFVDLDNNEYFNGKDYRRLIEDSYIEVHNKDDTVETIKLNYDFDYTNNTLAKDQTSENIYNQENIDILKDYQDLTVFQESKQSKIYEIAKPFIEENNLETYNVKLNGVSYEVSAVRNSLNILFKNGNKNYNLTYSIIDEKENIKLEIMGNTSKDLYSLNITKGTCKGSKCSQANKDLELIKNIIEKIKK